ncbi:MAG: chromosomal replication initiator protein DnaA [Thermoanaerobaculia bacterium]|nr:chromosomal replication initiator protein DnaA [Thermoanaerobaculia bacterium]
MSKSLWNSLRHELEQELDPEEFATWFRPLKVQDEDAERLILLAPNDHFLHTLEQSYRPAVDRAVADLKGPQFEVLFSLDDEESKSRGSKVDVPNPDLNPKYRFEAFVVGNSNQFAHAAARAVAESPSRSYNPLFLYGGVGLGKTHLLHAIAHEIQRSHPRRILAYLTAEQFVNELINSIRFDRMHAFRERYRNIDVLAIDDIQFLANKERTQEEFFHTFNTLYTSQKQIVLSSDAPPRSIPALEERLRSRFEWGLIADIQPPDLETKIVILRRKAELQELDLPDEVADFLAQQVRSNVRELEGLLNRVAAFAEFTGEPLSVELAKETLKDLVSESGRATPPGEIVKFVAHHYGLKVREIKSKSNAKMVAFPRQVAMWLIKQLTDLSYPDVGRLFNDKHHSTVMYSVDKIEKLQKEDSELERTLDRMIEHFR